MPRLASCRRSFSLGTLLLALVPFALGACGGSSKRSGESVKTTAGVPRQVQSHAAAVRSCLLKHGIELPARAAGSGGGARLPKGVSAAELNAALEKCSGGGRRTLAGVAESSASAAGGDQQIVRFATCMRAHGVKLPLPSGSGSAAVLDAKGVDTSSSAYKSAQTRCARELVAADAPGR